MEHVAHTSDETTGKVGLALDVHVGVAVGEHGRTTDVAHQTAGIASGHGQLTGYPYVGEGAHTLGTVGCDEVVMAHVAGQNAGA